MGDYYKPGYRRERSPPRRNDPSERDQRNGRHPPRNNRYMPVVSREPFDPPPRPRRYSRSPSPRIRMPLSSNRGRGSHTAGDFSFRGAADRGQPQGPQADFTFQAPGPRYPPRESLRDLNSLPQTRRAEGSGPKESYRGNRNSRRGGPPTRGRRGGFGRPPAHTRDILQSRRASTPEQLAGMNEEGHARFRSVESSEDDADEEDAPRKRAKVDSPAPEISRPQWSNPDPYTSLPPTETAGGPTKDIVNLIRKAQIDSAKSTDPKAAVENNVDFISLDEVFSEEGEASDDGPASPPDAQSKAYLGQNWNLSEKRKYHSQDSDSSIASPTEEEIIASFGKVPKGPKGQKRKREEQSTGAGEILLEWKLAGPNAAPWYKIDHSRTAKTGLRLHKEICDFYEYVRPTSSEENARRDVIARVNKVVQMHSGGEKVEVRCFGSFASGLYLPTADMDLVVVSNNFLRSGYPTVYKSNSQKHKLSRFLIKQGIADPDTVTVIVHAKVPIIKFVDRKTKIQVDISFENETGLIANDTFQSWKAQYPAMPALVMLIKQLLLMRGLNEVFNGGLGGFSIVCLVVSMIHNMPEVQSSNMVPEQHYGDLLVNFLDLYGNKFDITRTGIVMNPPGHFDKIRRPARKQNANNLTIIDPNNENNDISGGSRNINQVLACFRSAYAAIQRRLAQIDSGKNVRGSILECVLGGNYSSYKRVNHKAKFDDSNSFNR